MAYDPTIWVDDVTPVSALKMNKIEQGIADGEKIIPAVLTKDPVLPYPDFVPWKRSDFPTDTYRMYVNGQKYTFNMATIIGASALAPHFEGFIYKDGVNYVEFLEYSNGGDGGTTENDTSVTFGASYITLSLSYNDDPAYTNDVYIRTVSSFDLSSIKEIRIDWEGTLSAADTDFPMTLEVGNGVKALAHVETFTRRIETLSIADLFDSNYLYVRAEDNANWKGRTVTVKVYSIELVPFS